MALLAFVVAASAPVFAQQIVPIDPDIAELDGMDRPIEPPNIFEDAQAYAQRRCVKLYGGGIAREKGYGTGILVSRDGQILTAANILAANERIRVVTPDGELHYGQVVRRSDELQVALIKIEAETPEYFRVQEKAAAAHGDWVLAVSNAFKIADRQEPLSVNLGVVSLRTRLDTKKRMRDVDFEGDALIIDAITSNPGAPGGALVTIDGVLAGIIGKIIESKDTGTRLNYAVPNDQLRMFLDGKPINAEEEMPEAPPYTGIMIFKLGGESAPAYVDRVVPGSPAAFAGFKRDDMILSLGGEMVPTVDKYVELEPKLKPDEAVTIIVKRKSELIALELTPMAIDLDGEEDEESDDDTDQ